MGDPRDPPILPRSGVVDVKYHVAYVKEQTHKWQFRQHRKFAFSFCFYIFFLHPPHELPVTFFSEVMAQESSSTSSFIRAFICYVFFATYGSKFFPRSGVVAQGSPITSPIIQFL